MFRIIKTYKKLAHQLILKENIAFKTKNKIKIKNTLRKCHKKQKT